MIIEIAGQSITNIYDYTYALELLKIGQPAKVDLHARRREARNDADAAQKATVQSVGPSDFTPDKARW